MNTPNLMRKSPVQTQNATLASWSRPLPTINASLDVEPNVGEIGLI